MASPTTRVLMLVASLTAACRAGSAPSSAAGTAGADGSVASGMAGAGGAVTCPAPATLAPPFDTCTCPPGIPSLCPSGCSDLAVDDANCGACGHACPATSTCVRGGCRPEVATIVRGSSDCGQISFAVVDGVLYWTNELRGTVEGIGVDGSSRRTITSGEASPGAIAVIGSNLFWSAMGSEVTAADGGIAGRRLALRHMTLPDGAPADAAVEVGQAPGIRSLVASDDGRVLYYAFDNHVRAWPVAGGAATEVVEELSGDALSALAIDGTSFAGTTFAYLVAGRIELTPLVDRDVAMCDWRTRRAIGSPSCVLVEDGPEVLPALVLKSGRVYWSSGTTVAFTATTARVPAGAVGRIASSQSGTRVVGLFGGPDALYFVGGDVVERASYLPGFEAIPLARGQTPTGALAVDGSRVYWVNADCSIAAVPLD